MKTQLKKGNTVKILAGDEKGKTGEIIEIIKLISRRGILNKRAIVKGLNLVKNTKKLPKKTKVELLVLKNLFIYQIYLLFNQTRSLLKGKKKLVKKKLKARNQN